MEIEPSHLVAKSFRLHANYLCRRMQSVLRDISGKNTGLLIFCRQVVDLFIPVIFVRRTNVDVLFDRNFIECGLDAWLKVREKISISSI